jgi:hypothetical protein
MNATEPAAAAPGRRVLLSAQLEELRREFSGSRATVSEVITLLEGRAYTMLMIVLALPFAPPASVPGSSTPLGLIIAVVAAQLALGRLPWLPSRVLAWRLPAAFFAKLIPLTERIVRVLERVLHPRWPSWTETSTVRSIHLLTVVAAAVLLALPILIPFTNMLPGWAILLLACGLLERDGLFIFVGYLVFVATLAYFSFIAFAGVAAFRHGWQWLGG